MPDPVTIGVNTARESMRMNSKTPRTRRDRSHSGSSKRCIRWGKVPGLFVFLQFLQRMWPCGKLYLQKVTLANAAGTNQEG